MIARATVAAGSGITPIASIVATVLEAEPRSTVTLHYGSRDHAHIMLAAAIRELADRYPGRLAVTHHLSRQRTGPRAGPLGPAYRFDRIDPADIVCHEADEWFLCGPSRVTGRSWTRPSPGARTSPTPASAAPAEPASPHSKTAASRWTTIHCSRSRPGIANRAAYSRAGLGRSPRT
nr:hypothetical protein [Nocardia jinanensis]